MVSATESPLISGWQEIMAEAEDTPGVSHVSPSADSSVFVKRGDRALPVLLRGLDFGRADRIYKIRSALYEGWLPTTLATAQAIMEFGGNVTSVEMQVEKVFEADRVADYLRGRLDRPDLRVLDWKGQNRQLLSGLAAQSLSSYMIQFFVLVSVVVAIASVLAVKVVQKAREIGILKAMGIKDRSAGLVFLFQGAILGRAGALVGIILGTVLLLGFSAGAGSAQEGATIALTIDPVFLLGSWAVAVTSACLASLIPARKTTRLSPIEVIRGG